MNKRAIVFGSTGLVGKELVNELFGNNEFDKVIAVIRRDMAVSHPKLEQIKLEDFSDLMKMKESFNASVFFCCIGTTIKTAGSQEAFRQVDLIIPQKIAKLAEALSVPSLVIISSIGASHTSANFYLRTKGEMEKTVRELYSGNLKIVRPSLLMGKRDESRFGEKAAVGFMKIFGWIFEGPLKKYKGIYARDVARAMIRIAHFPPEKVVYESDELHNILKNGKQ